MTTEQRLSAIEESLKMAGLTSKKVLTLGEAAQFTGLSKSYLYKLTSQHRIPHFKPTGKLVYFDREELEAWLAQNRVQTVYEIKDQAQGYCMGRKGRK
ncbi:AlpA family transcriptional regulator [uncultured Rikenella sp.]|uniref:helix-turn-helix transcriptional regulator n=1 Tax=uncultured Rikenella sp. TaxID=368003 RepID=UPI00272C3D93|nr:helix-turn-helix domain-containing protein [uncultured Rikenella sp.]